MRRFRRSFWGYAPREVDRHLSRLETRLRETEERQRLAEGLVAVMKRHLSELKAAVQSLHEEREFVAQRLLSADEEARAIRQSALRDAQALRTYWAGQEQAAAAQLQAFREQLAELRRVSGLPAGSSEQPLHIGAVGEPPDSVADRPDRRGA